MTKEIPIIFHNRSNYGYHFIIKELANGLKGKFECLGENTEKHKTFSVRIENKIKKVDKDGNGDIPTVSYKINFIDSARFMVSSLSNLIDNLAEEIHKIRGWPFCSLLVARYFLLVTCYFLLVSFTRNEQKVTSNEQKVTTASKK